MAAAIKANDERGEKEVRSLFSFKQLFRDILVYSSGNILVKSMSLISAPIFTRVFTTAEYGAWSFIAAMVAFLNGILILGGEEAYARNYFACKTDEERKTLTSTWFIFLAAWSFLVALLIIPFSAKITLFFLEDLRFMTAWIVALLFSPVVMLNLLFSQALRNQFKAKAFTVLHVVTAGLTLVLSVLLIIVFDLGIVGALLGAGLAAAVMLAVRFWIIRELLAWRFSAAYLKKLLAFGAPLVPVVLAYWLFSNVDRIMLIKLSGLEDAGVYAIAISMVGVIFLIHGALGQSWLPHAIRLYEDDPDSARVIFGKTLNYFLAGIGFLVICFVGLSQEVLYVLVAGPFHGSYAAIPYLSLGILFFITTQVTYVGMLVKNKTVYMMLTCFIIALVNIGLNYLFIPLWGIVGAGAATGAAYLLFTLTYAVISWRLWPIVYYWHSIIKLVVVIIASIVSMIIVAGGVNQLWLAFGLKLLIMLVAGLVIAAIMVRSENINVRDYWRRLRGSFPGKSA